MQSTQMRDDACTRADLAERSSKYMVINLILTLNMICMHFGVLCQFTKQTEACKGIMQVMQPHVKCALLLGVDLPPA